MHNTNFMSFLFVKMRFLLLNAKWDHSFNFCSKSHRGEYWMWLSASQRNISLLLSCPFPFYSFLTKMIHTCLYEGFTSSQCLESICCIKCILPLVKRINAKQMLSPKLTATPFQSLSVHFGLLTSSTIIFVYFIQTCSLPFKMQGQRKLSPVSLANTSIPPVESAWFQHRPVSLVTWKYHINTTKKEKKELWQQVF